MWKQRIILSLWCLFGLFVCVLLTAAIRHKKDAHCSGIKVNIEGTQGHVFIDENDIVQLIKKNGAAVGKPIIDIPLQTLEKVLKHEPWISNAELFFDNRQVLQASITEREPLARIFTVAGVSFYIDSSGRQLPLSGDYAARVPMFTSFTSSKKSLSKPDSLLMNDIMKIAMQIQQNSFWMAQVSQVNITPRKTFEIIPVIGNQKILLGNADSLQSKFNRLFAFYKQVWATAGFEKYETISAEYSGQVVATKRGVPKPAIDTVQALRLISAMRDGTDIIKDSVKIIKGSLSLSVRPIDSTNKTVVKRIVLNNKRDSGKVHYVKPQPVTKGTSKQIKKAVMKSKNKTA